MKRGSPLKRTTPLSRGTKSMKRGAPMARTARLRKVGKRGRAIRDELRSVRTIVIERAGGRCERCRDERCKPLHLHHRRRRSQGGAHTPDNLHALGKRCHAAVHDGAEDAHLWLESNRGGSMRTARGHARDLSLRACPRFSNGKA